MQNDEFSFRIYRVLRTLNLKKISPKSVEFFQIIKENLFKSFKKILYVLHINNMDTNQIY